MKDEGSFVPGQADAPRGSISEAVMTMVFRHVEIGGRVYPPCCAVECGFGDGGDWFGFGRGWMLHVQCGFGIVLTESETLAAVLQSTDRFAVGWRRLAAVWGLGRLRPAQYR